MQTKLDLSKLNKQQREFLLKTGELLASQIALQLIRDRAIVPDGKTDEQLKDEVALFISSGLAKKTIQIKIGIDHTKHLLTEARRFFRQGEFELAAFYFATFFEHKLNWLIAEICRKNQVDESMIGQLLREANIRAKCTWVLALLGHKPLQPNIYNAIGAINEVRNAFIHYKWPNKETDRQKSAKLEAQMSEKLKKAETIIRYLQKFEEEQLYQGHGKRVRRAIKSLSASPGNNSNVQPRLAAPPK